MLSVILLEGCTDQNNSGPKLVTVPLNTLGFKSNELPDDVVKQNETYNDTEIFVEFPPDKTVIFLEVYRVEYGLSEMEIYLTLDMKKLNSTDVAKEQFEREKNDLLSSNFEIATDQEIGDDSVGVKLRDQYIIIFRKYNVLSTIYPFTADDSSLQDFIDYANIILNHIKSSV